MPEALGARGHLDALLTARGEEGLDDDVRATARQSIAQSFHERRARLIAPAW